MFVCVSQIAKAQGAFVATTCSGRNSDFVKKLGADTAIDYTKERYAGCTLLVHTAGGCLQFLPACADWLSIDKWQECAEGLLCTCVHLQV